MKFTNLALSICSATLFLSTAAHASNFYGGVDIYHVEGDVEGKKGYSVKDSSQETYGLTLGYALNDYVGIEAFYAESDQYEFKNFGAKLNVRYVLIGDVYGIGSIGVQQSQYDAFRTVTYLDGTSETTTSQDKTEIKPVFGAGIGYRINERVNIEAKYNKFEDLSSYGVSLLMRF